MLGVGPGLRVDSSAELLTGLIRIACQRDHLVASLQDGVDRMAADYPGRAGHRYPHEWHCAVIEVIMPPTITSCCIYLNRMYDV